MGAVYDFIRETQKRGKLGKRERGKEGKIKKIDEQKEGRDKGCNKGE